MGGYCSAVSTEEQSRAERRPQRRSSRKRLLLALQPSHCRCALKPSWISRDAHAKIQWLAYPGKQIKAEMTTTRSWMGLMEGRTDGMDSESRHGRDERIERGDGRESLSAGHGPLKSNLLDAPRSRLVGQATRPAASR
jgi:hypothetical protein